MTESETFGAWVRHRRRELDLTQEELARRVGCARITIRKIEAEQLRPSKQMAELLGERLGIAASQRENFMRFARGGVPATPDAVNPPRHNLPLQLTSFVGRDSELAQTRQLLQKSRLITLTGAGGTGKTRLALQVAAGLLDTFKDGCWFIELAPISDPTLVPTAIVSVLGVRQEPGRPLMDTLLDWLRNKQVLFILDNCEHLLDACAHFADAALHASPETRVLATSRQPLGMVGETSYRVPSLPCPDLAQAGHLHPEQLQEYPAARLFMERANGALATFNVQDTDALAVAEICQRLDGIPLAIELAAARVTALSVEQIAARLDDRFRLLASGNRTALPRHQTLRSLIDWSHNLLAEPERILLRRLSVFAGGWTLEAAEAVCVGNGIGPSEVPDLLTSLAEKSLIASDEHAAQPRYRMLETIRQYAGEKLLEAGERERRQDQHLHFFLQLAEASRPLLHTAERASWLLRLEADHDNVLAALGWACGRDPEAARWFAGILERFWFFGDHLGEARTWYARVLDRADDAPVSRGLALARLGAGCVAFNLDLMDEAQNALESSVRLWQQLGEPQWLASALEWLAYLLLQRGDAARADAIYAENNSLFRATSDGLNLIWILSSWGTAKAALDRNDPTGKSLLDDALTLAGVQQDAFCFMLCYSCLGDWAMLQGDYATASGYFLEALKWRRQLGTRWIVAAGLWQVGSMSRLQGDYEGAEPMYAEALKLARDVGDRRSEAHIGQELGVVAMHLGAFGQATGLLAGSLAAFYKWADPLGIARCILGFSDLRGMQGLEETAARLLGFLESWLQSNKIQLLHFDRSNYERSVKAARAELTEPAFTASQAAGSNLTLEQAVSLALGEDPIQLGLERAKSNPVS